MSARETSQLIDTETTWITADWHLGETRFDLMRRPFKCSEEMTETLIELHNAWVRPDDLVLVVGDVCYKEQPAALAHTARFHGRKWLFRGNHDAVFSDEQLQPYFERIIPEGEGLELTIAGIACFIVHYPTCGRADRFNLVGHIHGAWRYQLNMWNVGVDCSHFCPHPLRDLPKHFQALDMYDADVWAAYNPINANHQATRGKKTSYFSK